MKIFITGGCKNGKSFYAQTLSEKLSSGSKKYYIATMKPVDYEDDERIKKHKDEREGFEFETIEQPFDILECIKKCKKDSTILLDSTTALLTNEMFLKNKTFNLDAHIQISEDLISLSNHVKNIVIVSDYIYSNAEFFEDFTEKYKYSLAYIDKKISKDFDVVCEVSFGNILFLKGANLF